MDVHDAFPHEKFNKFTSSTPAALSLLLLHTLVSSESMTQQTLLCCYVLMTQPEASNTTPIGDDPRPAAIPPGSAGCSTDHRQHITRRQLQRVLF